MSAEKRYGQVIKRLRAAGLRPTKQRIALASMMFTGEDRHFSAEQLHGEAVAGGIAVSLATVYNSLHQFTNAGLLREITVDSGRSYFDTNTSDHHHFYFEGSRRLADIAADDVVLSQIPEPPAGAKISRIDVIVRVSEE